MLAAVNVAILSFWLVVELVPVVADALADRECRQRCLGDDD